MGLGHHLVPSSRYGAEFQAREVLATHSVGLQGVFFATDTL